MSDAQAVMGTMLAIGPNQPNWYAVQTRARHEKKVLAELQRRGIDAYMPVVTATRCWSDRRKQVELPLFSCYTFVRIIRTPEARLDVLKVNGVIDFVGDHRLGEAIPDEQIDAVRALLQSDVPFSEHAFLSVGQRVRLRGGALNGIEGILTAVNGSRRLVISIESIQRSISVSVEGYGVEVLSVPEYRA